MSLLREIQNDAVNSNVKVSDLLRKCKILAYRLGNTDFKNWVESELNGYPKDLEELPEYRILRNISSKGHFSGAFGSGLRNADMPTFNLPKDLQDSLSKAIFYSPIATLENLASSESSALTQAWKPIIIAHYGSDMYENYVCMQAWKVIPTSFVIGMVDTIKTKILNFVLEIEMISKDAGDVESNSNPISQEKVSQIFNINISGNVQNLASGNHHSNLQQNASSTELPEDFVKLLVELRQLNLDEAIAFEAEQKVEQLGAVVGTPEYKQKYNELMSFASNHVTVMSLLATFITTLTNYLP